MKKTFIYIAVICAAMLAGVSCEKIEQPQPQSPVDNPEIEEKEGTYSVTFECSMAESEGDTKTEFHNNGDGTQGIWWSVGDEINIYQMRYKNDTDLASQVSKQTVPEKDKLDKFSCKITNFTEPSRYPVYYWALFPAGSVKSHRTSFTGEEVYYAQMDVPAEQSPSADTFDPKADVLVSKYITSNEKQTTFNLQFRRVVALGKMTIKNLQSENAIKSIKFENNNSYLAGDGFYELEGTGTRNGVASSTGSTSITMNYHENLNITADSGDGMTAYFTCRAFTLAKGKKFKVTVTTYAGEVFTKEVTIPETLEDGFKFEEGRATKFTVDMSTVAQDEATVTIGEATTSHSTIAAAFTAANNADGAATIKLMKNCTANTALTVSNENGITLDLNGHVADAKVDVSKNFTIQSSVAGGKITSSESTITVNEGVNLTLESGTIESTFNSKFDIGKAAIYAKSNSTNSKIQITVNGGNIQGTGLSAVYLYNAKLTMSESYNGTFSGARVIVASANAEATINASQGTFKSTGTTANDAIFHFGSALANITVSKGNFETNEYIVNTSNKGTLNITGGYFKTTGNELSVATNDDNATNVSFEGGYFSNEVAKCLKTNYSCYQTNEHTDYPYSVLPTGVALFRAGTDKVESKTTINDAIDAANSATGKECTITLVNDCQVQGSSAVDVTNSAGVTLDLNGKILTLTSSAFLRVNNDGNLIIDNNNTTEGFVKGGSSYYVISVSKGYLTIRGGTIESTYSSPNNNVVAAVGSTQSNTTSITIEGGSLTAPSGSGYGLYVNNSNCTVYVEEGGQISSDVNNSIRIMSGNLMISGGKIVARGASKYALEIGSGLSATNSITISGGQLISEQYSTVRVYAKDGTISITGNAYFYSGETSTEPAIFRYSTNTIKVSASAYGYFGSASESFDKSKVDVQIDGAYHVGNIGNPVNYDGYTYKCKMYSGAQ